MKTLFVNFLLCFAAGFIQLAAAQTTVQGRVISAENRQPLLAASVLLQADGQPAVGGSTDAQGRFSITVKPGKYRLRIQYIGYHSFDSGLVVGEMPIRLRPVVLVEDAKLLQEVEISGLQKRVSQQGDTTSLHAEAFKVNRDANAEELVRKMPGIQIENGQVTAQGESVRRVLVDGQEFFGEDATLALRSLPAEIIDRVQLFDRLSDQAQFTGFNDGNTEKTINIVTKNGKNSGIFGRAFAGYGSDQRYQAGGNVNYFKGQRRITLLGQSNNTNQQNFSSQDLVGLSNEGGRGGMRGGGRGNWGGGSSQNFLVGQQAGINQTQALGLNYTDRWGAKAKVNASYFFNAGENNTEQDLNRQFYQADGLGPVYSETTRDRAINYNHRFDMRLEYDIDSSNSLIFRPRLRYQDNSSLGLLSGRNQTTGLLPINSTETSNSREQAAWQGEIDLLWRHRMKKQGRTWSVRTEYNFNQRTTRSELQATNQFFGLTDSLQLIDQESTAEGAAQTLGLEISYTEPVGKIGQFSVSYRPSINRQKNNQFTRALDTLSNQYTLVDSQLSNQFDSEQLTQRVQFHLRFRGSKWGGGLGLGLQYTDLQGQQFFPNSQNIARGFRNLLPNAMLSYTIDRTNNLRLFYRSSTNLPSVTQLQPLVNNSNPLQLSIGNPDLLQEENHQLVLRYNHNNADKGHSLSVFGLASIQPNYIGSTTTIARSDTLIQGILLARGGRLTQNTNLSGAWNSRAVVTYGLPVSWLKSNVNVNAAVGYNQVPGRVNGIDNFARTTTISSGLVLGSNISEAIDFTLSYTLSTNRVINSVEPALNANYLNQLAGLRANWQPTLKWMISSEWAYTHYRGLAAGIDPDFLLWNAGIGYRLGKKGDGEIRLSSFDLLGQNQAIGRTVSDIFVDDSRTSVLQRYFLLTLTWNIRQFKAAA